MSKKIRFDDLTDTLQKYLRDYAEEVSDDVKESVDVVTKGAHKVVKNKAPVDQKNVSRKGKYKKSIKSRTVYESLTEKKNAIYASDGEYRLTHLLEKGHRMHFGGEARAFPHFADGEKYIKKNLEEEILKRIKK